MTADWCPATEACTGSTVETHDGIFLCYKEWISERKKWCSYIIISKGTGENNKAMAFIENRGAWRWPYQVRPRKTNTVSLTCSSLALWRHINLCVFIRHELKANLYRVTKGSNGRGRKEGRGRGWGMYSLYNICLYKMYFHIQHHIQWIYVLIFKKVLPDLVWDSFLSQLPFQTLKMCTLSTTTWQKHCRNTVYRRIKLGEECWEENMAVHY